MVPPPPGNANGNTVLALSKFDKFGLIQPGDQLIKLALKSSPLYFNNNAMCIALSLTKGVWTVKFQDKLQSKDEPRVRGEILLPDGFFDNIGTLRALLLDTLVRVANAALKSPIPYPGDMQTCLLQLVALTVFCGLEATHSIMEKTIGGYSVGLLMKAGVLLKVRGALHLSTDLLMRVHILDFIAKVRSWFPEFLLTLEPYPEWIHLVYSFLGLTASTDKGKHFEQVCIPPQIPTHLSVYSSKTAFQKQFPGK